MQYQSKTDSTIRIDAVRFENNVTEIAQFVGGDAYIRDDGQVEAAGPKGATRAAPGEWIIKSIGGDLYICPDDLFQEGYEIAPD